MPRRGLILAALVLVLDQASKWWILLDVMAPPRMIEVTGFFNLVLVWNPGISFGLFGGGGGRWLLAGLAVAIAVALVVWMVRTVRPWLAVALGLVVGGALGNALDRLIHGRVVDFLDFHLAGFHWPAFNLADSAITVGVVVMLVDSLFEKRAAPNI
ncbi:MAG: signal peptidase II [Rhodospirillaceae bacterium]|nr:signal peptidase II [Rhodospirillaceae bacterium]MBT6117868.1 signal peptidase II [Rhodospirillaceae bacterium]